MIFWFRAPELEPFNFKKVCIELTLNVHVLSGSFNYAEDTNRLFRFFHPGPPNLGVMAN